MLVTVDGSAILAMGPNQVFNAMKAGRLSSDAIAKLGRGSNVMTVHEDKIVVCIVIGRKKEEGGDNTMPVLVSLGAPAALLATIARDMPHMPARLRCPSAPAVLL